MAGGEVEPSMDVGCRMGKGEAPGAEASTQARHYPLTSLYSSTEPKATRLHTPCTHLLCP
eukprot:7792963-Karenia_brevis.AAC.1